MIRPKAALLTGPVLLSLASLLAASGPSTSIPAPDEGGTISGKVTFNGERPKMPPINFDADPVCSQMHQGEKATKEEVVVNGNGTLKNVLVYVKSSSKALEGKKFDAPKEAVVLDQKGCTYKPHVFGVMAGQAITIRNSDETSHNIKCAPKKNTGFNISQAKKGMEEPKSFDKEEVIRVECNVHPWMNGYVGVFSHPFFAVTGEDGTFTIPGVPPGEVEIVAWHESPRLDGQKTQTATVAAGPPVTVDFAFAPKAKGEKKE
ncbi:MAG: carboxypeptidase regulatory-like domain-containing protein [Planctomycetes bacterium]|nr:carboxypeptidase regulatory-like domain-containing protein [Planctomycetota bacterium]